MPSDEHLIHLIANGDRNAFVEVYNLYSTQVYNTAIGYLQNKEEAEEAVQDIFLEIHRSASRFRADSKISTWIYRITVNKCLDRLRKRKAVKRMTVIRSVFRKEDQPVGPVGFNHPGVQLEKKEDAKMLFAAIEELPERQKTAFILSFVEDLSRQEAADIMQISLKSLESLLQRAKQNLRNRLKEKFPERRKKP